MYLSCLLIDVGTNPDRPRPGRLWLRNLYRVHQRLCMAFPSPARESDDAHYLKPFDPDDFASEEVHVCRGENAGFLFRIDPQQGGSAVVLVQSATQPNWDYAFHNAGHLLRCPPQVRRFSPAFSVGQMLRFRLLANPTKRLCSQSKVRGQPVEESWIGKRVPVPTDMLEDWLTARAEPAGFRVARLSSVQAGFVYMNNTREPGKGLRLRSARYEGVLEVTDPARFQAALVGGVGPAKAFGFGLLSLAPA